MLDWIPYSQIKCLTEIARGGFGIIYKAFMLNPNSNQIVLVAIKRFLNSRISETLLNEVII